MGLIKHRSRSEFEKERNKLIYEGRRQSVEKRQHQLLTQARARLRGRGSEESSANAGTAVDESATAATLSLRVDHRKSPSPGKGRSPNSRRSSNVFTAGDDADTSEFEVDANEIEQALSSMGSQLVQQDMVRHTFGKSDHMNVDDGIVAKNVEVLRQEVASIMKHVNTTIDTRMTAGTNAASASGSATGAVMAPADLDKKLADVQAAVESKIDGVQRDFGQQIADVKHALDGLARLMQKIDGDLQTRRSA